MKREVPLPIVIVLFVALTGLFAGIFYYFHQTEYAYNLNLLGGDDSTKLLAYGPNSILSNADFFKTTRDSMVSQGTNFIEADLSAMKLRVYKEGKSVLEVNILTKGKDGLWWQTPAGLYKVESKEPKHYSSFAGVYENWDLAFQGNFFIHGWPYYANGKPVSSQFSGGCIRLSDEDAKAVYDIAHVGMPVLIFEDNFKSDNFSYEPKDLGLTAPSYLVADLKSNVVLLSNDATSTLSIAYVTKLLTALVSAEYINLDTVVTIKESMIEPTSKPRLYRGEKVTAYNLLFPLLLESSNEAANALAQVVGTKRFVSLMNTKAKSMGMTSTVFTDPAGKDPTNVSTHQDLFALAKYLYFNRRFVLGISSQTLKVTAYDKHDFPGLQNFNLYGGDPTFVGGNVGETEETKETMLAVFNLPIGQTTRPIAISILGSENVKADMDLILAYIKSHY